MTHEIIQAAQAATELYASDDVLEGQPPRRQLTVGGLYLFYGPKNQPDTSDPTHFIEELRTSFKAGTLHTEDAEATIGLLTHAWQTETLMTPGLKGANAPKQHAFVGVMKALDVLDQRVELSAQPA